LSKKSKQPLIFGKNAGDWSLPVNYTPCRPRFFTVKNIFLTRGSLSSPERIRFVENICKLYPEAEIFECPDLPHNRIDFAEPDRLSLHQKGKTTLVFGEHKSAVRFSEEEGNACPNYWHFSPYGFCFYGCNYCYLAGTPGVWHSPSVKIFLNIEEIIEEMEAGATKLRSPIVFYLGKLQDGLALDPLTAYSTILIPFFAQNKFARQIILTKSAEIDRLLQLEHNQRTIISWSVNPPGVSARFEQNVPPMEDRIIAMKKCAEAGYPVRAVMMPLIPVPNWEKIYSRFAQLLIRAAPIQRLTLGGICIYQNALKLMDMKMTRKNDISLKIDRSTKLKDGRARYSRSLRVKMYSHIIKTVREIKPGLELALCLEEASVRKELGLEGRIGRCNCVL